MTGCLWGQSVRPSYSECRVRATDKATEFQGRVHSPLPLPTAPAVSLSALYSVQRYFLVILVLNFIHSVQARAGPHFTDEETEAKERKPLTRGHSRSLDGSPGSRAAPSSALVPHQRKHRRGHWPGWGDSVAEAVCGMTINLVSDSGAQSEKQDGGTCALLLCSAKDVASFLSPHGTGQRVANGAASGVRSTRVQVPAFPLTAGRGASHQLLRASLFLSVKW